MATSQHLECFQAPLPQVPHTKRAAKNLTGWVAPESRAQDGHGIGSLKISLHFSGRKHLGHLGHLILGREQTDFIWFTCWDRGKSQGDRRAIRSAQGMSSRDGTVHLSWFCFRTVLDSDQYDMYNGNRHKCMFEYVWKWDIPFEWACNGDDYDSLSFSIEIDGNQWN